MTFWDFSETSITAKDAKIAKHSSNILCVLRVLCGEITPPGHRTLTLANRCVECGRLIQAGNLCKQCEEIKSLKQNLQSVKAVLDGIMNAPTTGIDTSKLHFDNESKKLVLKQ